MTINSMENVLKDRNLFIVHHQGIEKRYINGQTLFEDGHFKNRKNVFGIYKDDNCNYHFFITDSERGLPFYGDEYKTESDACQALIDDISLFDDFYEEPNSI